MAPSSSRRRRAVNTKKSIAATIDTINYNIESSQLLQLPPEIRGSIYGYVLGGRTIHLRIHDDGGLWHNLCHEDEPDRSFLDRMVKNGTESYEATAERHQRCIRDDSGRSPSTDSMIEKDCISLGLLRTCRLIYQEAVLLPFALNTFDFETCYDLTALNSYFTPAQRRSINDMVVYAAHGGPSAQAGCGPKLTGLKHLTVIAENGFYVGESDEEPLQVEGIYYRFLDFKFSRLLALSSIRVYIEPEQRNRSVHGVVYAERVKAGRPISRRIEYDLLNPWDKDGRGAQEDARRAEEDAERKKRRAEEDAKRKKREQARSANRARCELRTTKPISYV